MSFFQRGFVTRVIRFRGSLDGFCVISGSGCKLLMQGVSEAFSSKPFRLRAC